MKFKNNRAVDVPFKQAQHQRGAIKPQLIILHDTASRLEHGNAARYLQNNAAKVSIHFVVERDGSIEQQVPVNRGANHAGTSEYHGQKNCNDFSIGIEIVNVGRMDFAGEGKSRAWFGTIFDNAKESIRRVSTPPHGDHWWMPYTEEQITAVLDICQGLVSYIPTIMDIQPHWYVSPGRKTDTNPLFPLDEVRSQVFGRRDVMALVADGLTDVRAEEPYGWVKTNTPNGNLNLRKWPSFNPNIISTIPHGTTLPVERTGTFGGREWAKVHFDGMSGWVVKKYLSDPK